MVATSRSRVRWGCPTLDLDASGEATATYLLAFGEVHINPTMRAIIDGVIDVPDFVAYDRTPTRLP